MCIRPNGNLSFVSAQETERKTPLSRLDEWDNAETAEDLRHFQNFMADFRLTDDGELEFHAFGETRYGAEPIQFSTKLV